MKKFPAEELAGYWREYMDNRNAGEPYYKSHNKTMVDRNRSYWMCHLIRCYGVGVVEAIKQVERSS